MPYRKVSYAEQMWYILKFKWKEVTRMPRKPKHPCHYPGCPKLTDNRFCEEHTKLYNRNYEKYDRDPAVHRRYGRAWKRIRDSYVKTHPFCEQCYAKGIIVPVEEVHHKLPWQRVELTAETILFPCAKAVMPNYTQTVVTGGRGSQCLMKRKQKVQQKTSSDSCGCHFKDFSIFYGNFCE